MATCSTCYISCGCNRSPFAADWGENNLICYGSCRSVAIYSPEGWKNRPSNVISTLTGHQGLVNCVQWIKQPNGTEEELVSGSVDMTVRVWKVDGEKFQLVTTLKGHTGAINTVATLKYREVGTDVDTVIIASASVDSTVRIWKREGQENDFEEIQMLSYGSGFALAVTFALLPNTTIPILSCGLDDCKVHLYALTNGKFEKKMVLSGHEDWVRDLDAVQEDGGDLLLTSCSQDHSIRMWRISLRDTDTSRLTNAVSTLAPEEDIQMKENTFDIFYQDHMQYYAVSLDSVLFGHENWVYSVRWKSRQYRGTSWHQPMCLLSASMDKTMIIWELDTNSGVWLEAVRVGDVGGNSLGFYGGLMAPNGLSILAHGYHGAFHQWTCSQEGSIWEPSVTGGGHFASVQDLDWDREGGEFIVSISEDQTTRLHAPWVDENRDVCWYEIARPQIHGYDLQCLAMIGRCQFATGADEKVVRVFQAPRNFINNFSYLSGVCLDSNIQNESVPEGATVPALGLSNKAVFSWDESLRSENKQASNNSGQYPEVYFKPMSFQAPPSEENLLQNTLWPELQKLYGHSYEIFALASDPQKTVLASACKAAKAEYACVLLWDLSTWRQICSLGGATLTVTQMAFSNDGTYLLIVSRDRSWSLFHKQDVTWIKACGVDKKSTPHTRIIWACCWTHDDKYFITVSRDKKAYIWSTDGVVDSKSSPEPVSSIDLPSAVTAVDVAPVHREYLVSFGLESGHILLYKWFDQANTWAYCLTLPNSTAHHMAVKRLRFRPVLGRAGIKTDESSSSNWLQLASCSMDHAVKVHSIDISKL